MADAYPGNTVYKTHATRRKFLQSQLLLRILRAGMQRKSLLNNA